MKWIENKRVDDIAGKYPGFKDYYRDKKREQRESTQGCLGLGFLGLLGGLLYGTLSDEQKQAVWDDDY